MDLNCSGFVLETNRGGTLHKEETRKVKSFAVVMSESASSVFGKSSN